MQLAFCGVDIAKETACAQMVSPMGEKKGKHFFFQQSLDGFEDFLKRFENLDQVVVGLESTGPYGKALIDYLQLQAIPVLELNPIKTKREEKRRVRKLKTDPANALDIAEVTRKEYFSRQEFKVDRDLMMARDLVRARNSLKEHIMVMKSQIRGHLVVVNPGLEKVFKNLWCNTGLAILKKWSTSRRLKEAGLDAITELIARTSGGTLGRKKAEEILETCCEKYHCVADRDHDLGLVIKMWASMIIDLEEKIYRLDKMVLRKVPRWEVDLVSTIPGISETAAAAIISELGPGENFRTSNQIVAFIGLDPSVRKSGNWEGRSQMSKRGSPSARNAIYRCMSSAVQHNPVCKMAYLEKIMAGRKSRDAMSIACRHMARIIRSVRYYRKPFYVPDGVEERVKVLEGQYEKKFGKPFGKRKKV